MRRRQRQRRLRDRLSSPSVPTSAVSAADTRRIVGASAVIATRASVIVPATTVTTAVAPTTAISIWRRYSRRTYAEPVAGPGAGRSSRDEQLTRRRQPWSPGRSRARPSTLLARLTSTAGRPMAPKHSSGPPVSIAGEAFITLPPIVPCARVACEPTIAEASASAVNRSRIDAVREDRPRASTSAPRRRPPSSLDDPSERLDPIDRDDARQRVLALTGRTPGRSRRRPAALPSRARERVLERDRGRERSSSPVDLSETRPRRARASSAGGGPGFRAPTRSRSRSPRRWGPGGARPRPSNRAGPRPAVGICTQSTSICGASEHVTSL